MSDENADKISGQAGDTPPIDPALFERDDVRRVLVALDIGNLYRLLGGRCLADIVAGRRQVESHRLLMRIVEGFDIPRESMGLSWWGPDGT